MRCNRAGALPDSAESGNTKWISPLAVPAVAENGLQAFGDRVLAPLE